MLSSNTLKADKTDDEATITGFKSTMINEVVFEILSGTVLYNMYIAALDRSFSLTRFDINMF